MGTMIHTKQQSRADFALNEICEICNANKGVVPTKTSKFFIDLPTLILSNGLGQSLAFMLAKGEEKHRTSFKILKKYLCQNDENYKKYFTDVSQDMDFIQKMNQIDQNIYFNIQREVLRLCEWLKRYGKAFAEEEK